MIRLLEIASNGVESGGPHREVMIRQIKDLVPAGVGNVVDIYVAHTHISHDTVMDCSLVQPGGSHEKKFQFM